MCACTGTPDGLAIVTLLAPPLIVTWTVPSGDGRCTSRWLAPAHRTPVGAADFTTIAWAGVAVTSSAPPMSVTTAHCAFVPRT